jgi:hypothetical protein
MVLRIEGHMRRLSCCSTPSFWVFALTAATWLGCARPRSQPGSPGSTAGQDAAGPEGGVGGARGAGEGTGTGGAFGQTSSQIDAELDRGPTSPDQAPAPDSNPDAPPTPPVDRCQAAACGATADGCCPAGCLSSTDADCPPANRLFVTSTTYTGNLGGLVGADARCNERARAAGLEGKFIAMLSTSRVAAFSRLDGSRGWVRTDGKPFVDTTADLAAGRIYYPPIADEFGKPRPYQAGDQNVFAATFEDGRPDDRNCSDWTTTAGMVTGGLTHATTKVWITQWGGGCDTAAHLYCFEIGRNTAVLPPPLPAAARRAFVLPQVSLTQGIAEADQRCATAARNAGLAGEYLAFMATSTASAVSRFDLSGAPWYRPDGIPIVGAAADIAINKLVSAVSLEASGEPAPWSGVWTGSTSPATVGSQTCGDWRSTAAASQGWSGDSSQVSPRWFGHPADVYSGGSEAACDRGYLALYCFAR